LRLQRINMPPFDRAVKLIRIEQLSFDRAWQTALRRPHRHIPSKFGPTFDKINLLW
jgi:hypothetical protein